MSNAFQENEVGGRGDVVDFFQIFLTYGWTKPRGRNEAHVSSDKVLDNNL